MMIKDPEKGKEEIRGYSNDIKVEAATDGKEIELEESKLGKTTTEEIEPMIPKIIVKLKPKTGLYLVAPHGEMIATTQKTLIVKSKKFEAHIGEPIYLLQDKVCYGIITLKEPREITPIEFEKLREKHQITDEEAFKHWGWKKDTPLFAYEFRIEEIWDPPLPVKIPQGIQVFVDAKNIKFQDVKNLTILDLFDYAGVAISEELFAEVTEELFNRNLFKSQVFQLIRGWISDYDVNKPNDRQLGDDYRIVLGWYSSLKRGKKLFKKVGDEKKEITLEDCKELGLKIFKEMIRRGFTFNKPETYKKHARELYEWIISQVGEKNVPFKDKEEKAKTVPEPKKIERPDLEDVDDVYAASLSDEDLLALDKQLHEIFKEIGKVTEPLENAHIFVWKEMRKRKLPHDIQDGLTRETSLEVIEYPEPEQGEPQKISLEEFAKNIKLQEVLEAFPDHILIDDPIHVYLCGRVVNEGEIPSSHDLDLLFKQGWYHVPTVKTFLDEVSKRNPEVSKRLHFVWDSAGPHIGYCYDEKTEVLTRKGWLPFSLLTSGEEVLTLNLNTEKAEYQKCISHAFDYDGTMVQIKNQNNFDLKVNPPHRLLLFERHTKSPFFRLAREKVTHHLIRRDIPWIGKEEEIFILPTYAKTWEIRHRRGDRIWTSSHRYFKPEQSFPMDLWLKFFGFWVTEGWTTEREIGLAQNEGSTLQEMEKTLKTLGIHYWKDSHRKNVQLHIKDRQLWSYLKSFGKNREKRIPQEYLELSERQLKILKEAMLKGDGTQCGNWRFFTSSKLLADNMQELMQKTGSAAQIKYRPERETFEVYESNDRFFRLRKESYLEVPYRGKIYCAEVPNLTLFVRRNGKACWSGNTVPMYRLAFIRVGPDEMKKTSPFEFLAVAGPQVFKPYIGMKPKSGFEKNEFWDIKEMWEKWAKNYIDKGIVIQKKFDGMRFEIHCKGQEIKCFTEDRQRDRATVFKKSIAEILKHKKVDSFIVDAEMVEYACGTKITNRPDLCEQMPREEMIKWIGAERKEMDDENVVFHIHDCTFLDGEALNEKGYVDRWNAISKIFSELKHWKKVEGTETHDMRGFFSLAKKYRSLTNSEGIVAKASDSKYPIKYSGENRTAEWAKLKNLKEIDVMVWKVIQKKTSAGKPLNQWLYECVFSIPCADESKYREKDVVKIQGKCYLWIGRSYATGEKVSPGTIIIVRPIRVAEFKDPKGKLYYTWMFPYYDGKHPAKTAPDSIDVVKKLIAIGTGPGKEKLSTQVFDLPVCPFWNDSQICILKERFKLPRDELSEIKVQYLRFPVVCRFANHYKCRYLKKYYYGYRTWETKSVCDEDDLNLTGEED